MGVICSIYNYTEDKQNHDSLVSSDSLVENNLHGEYKNKDKKTQQDLRNNLNTRKSKSISYTDHQPNLNRGGALKNSKNQKNPINSFSNIYSVNNNNNLKITSNKTYNSEEGVIANINKEEFGKKKILKNKLKLKILKLKILKLNLIFV